MNNITLDQYLDLKESIAFDVFEYAAEDYVRPSEQDCHAIAEIIINRVLNKEQTT